MSTPRYTDTFIFQHINTFKSHNRSDVGSIIIILILLGKKGPKPKLRHRETNHVLETNSQRAAMMGFEPRWANARRCPSQLRQPASRSEQEERGEQGHWVQYNLKTLMTVFKEQDIKLPQFTELTRHQATSRWGKEGR